MSVSQGSSTGTRPSAANRPQLDVLRDPARLAAVDRILSAGPPTRVLQRLTVVAAQLLDTPCAQVSLLSAEGQVVPALVGAAAGRGRGCRRPSRPQTVSCGLAWRGRWRG